MEGADWFHWSGITPAISDKAAELTRLACEAAKRHGVTVSVDENTAGYLNRNYGFNIQSGSAVRLNGDEALAYCRSRKCYNDGDITVIYAHRQ